jgi:acyl-coenzyme A synthetase/AMP-(fatty) acid ligase
MFVRMLKLPDDARLRYDLSSHRCAIHAAAPCPVEVKRRMIEWWGPIIEEYYSATEGMGATYINSEQWLAHPGSVGPTLLAPIHIVDEDGNDVPTGDVGTGTWNWRRAAPASSTTKTWRRRRRRSTRAGGPASVTWVTSTPTATSISPIAGRS